MWEDIELRELRVFLVLAEELHFGRTAERLQLTPSRVSQLLRSLERKLGGQLFHRTSRRVELTALGERFHKQVSAAHAQLAGVLEHTHEETHGPQATLSIGLLTPVIEGPHLPEITNVFGRRHPECDVEIRRAPYGDAFGSMRRGEFDLLLSWLPHGQADVVTGPILTHDRMVVAVAYDHPLAERAKVSLEDIADYRILPIEETMPPALAEIWGPCRSPSGRTIQRMQVPFGQMARDDPSNLRQQMSWWIQNGEVLHLTVSAVSTLLGTNIAYVPIADLPPMNAALVWPRRVANPLLRDFVGAARDVLRSTRHRRASRADRDKAEVRLHSA